MLIQSWKKLVNQRNIFLVAEKTKKDVAFWPRLQKPEGKLPFVKIDFSRFRDEDSDDEEKNQQPMMDAQLAQMMSSLGGGIGGKGMDFGMPEEGAESDEETQGNEEIKSE